MLRCVAQRAARHAAQAIITRAQARSLSTSTSSAARAIAQTRGGGHRHVVGQAMPKAYESSATVARRSLAAAAAVTCQCALPREFGSCIVRGVLAEARSMVVARSINFVFWKNYAAFLFGCYASSKVLTWVQNGRFRDAKEKLKLIEEQEKEVELRKQELEVAVKDQRRKGWFWG